ncbi:MAG TPA: NIPSNAP family protein [Ferrovibrio sp.]|uniref:NIPSNAP family protein n=1 Tax=Ferrovibrio sp. TaxID=1917215 RepID=UPI002B4AB173|nr:NIPSNAP family protein [Ferrovibrio sp.]HLT76338.1 NIPSNAP family protein [Ferrovibrio sp.]
MRTYTIRPGGLPVFLKHYEAEGLPIIQPILGNLLGYFTSEIGELNQVVHLWGYADLEDRAKRRARLNADAAWIAFTPKILPLIERMQNSILNPTSFSPIR